MLTWFENWYKRLFGAGELVLVRRYPITTGMVGELYENGRFLTHTLDSLDNKQADYNLTSSSFETDEFTSKLANNKIRLDPNRRLILPRAIRLKVLNRYAQSI